MELYYPTIITFNITTNISTCSFQKDLSLGKSFCTGGHCMEMSVLSVSTAGWSLPQASLCTHNEPTKSLGTYSTWNDCLWLSVNAVVCLWSSGSLLIQTKTSLKLHHLTSWFRISSPLWSYVWNNFHSFEYNYFFYQNCSMPTETLKGACSVYININAPNR